jgi:hypothetical protein
MLGDVAERGNELILGHRVYRAEVKWKVVCAKWFRHLLSVPARVRPSSPSLVGAGRGLTLGQ